MNVIFLNSFKKDISKIKDNSLKMKVKKVIIHIEKSDDLKGISNNKKLSGSQIAYRIRIGKYRIGYYYQNNIIEFARFLKRNEIYEKFP